MRELSEYQTISMQDTDNGSPRVESQEPMFDAEMEDSITQQNGGLANDTPENSIELDNSTFNTRLELIAETKIG